MKSIFLSVVVISALLIAGIGGTLASYVDTELQVDDTLQTGSIDLQVKYDGDFEDDPFLDSFHLKGLKPDEGVDVTKYVRNMGTLDGKFYIHFMNITSEEADDKLFGDPPRLQHPEPEFVAEMGGQVGTYWVAGLGQLSDYSANVEVDIRITDPAGDITIVDLKQYDSNGDGTVTLDELVCNQIDCGILMACGVTYEVQYVFTFFNLTNGIFVYELNEARDGPTGAMIRIDDWKFRDWPTNAYMGDILHFDVLYELWDGAPPAP